MNRAFEATAAQTEEPTRGLHVPAQTPKLLSQIEVCRRLGIAIQTWRNWRRDGSVPPPVDGPHRRPHWRVADIERIEQGRGVAQPGRRVFFGSAVRRRA